MLGELIAHGLLAFDAIGLFEGSDVEPAFLLGSGGHHAGAVADQAVDQRYVRAVGLTFHEIGLRDVARHENVGFQARRRCIGRHGARRVPSRGNGQLANPQLHRHGDGAGKPARFERAGGIEAFVLHP